MNPDIAGTGRSFKGLTAYLIHDIGKSSSERLLFSECLNLRTNDPEKAAKVMAWTALHSDDLKRQAGVKLTGRKGDPVFHYSLNWHPEEEPTREEMIAAGRETLKRLGLAEHEAVLVAHQDKDHRHLHVMVNRVHPETGTMPKSSFNKRVLQGWAYEYEKSRGKIYCEDRILIYEKDPEILKAAQARATEKRKDWEETKEKSSKPRPQWEAEKGASAGKAKANAIRAEQAEKTKALAIETRAINQRQKQERDALWSEYKAGKDAIWQRAKIDNQKNVDKIFAEQKTEFANFFSQQRDEQRRAREHAYQAKKLARICFRSVFGIDIGYKGIKSGGFLSQLFAAVIDEGIAKYHMEKQQEADKRLQAFKSMQKAKRTEAIQQQREHYKQTIAAKETARTREIFNIRMDLLKQKHAQERAAIEAAWYHRNLERQRAWDGFKKEITEKQQQAQARRERTDRYFANKRARENAAQEHARDLGQPRGRPGPAVR